MGGAYAVFKKLQEWHATGTEDLPDTAVTGEERESVKSKRKLPLRNRKLSATDF